MENRKTNIWQEAYEFILAVLEKRKIIWELVKRELKIAYSKNYLGLIWALLEPLAMMSILWLVFTFMRQGPGGEHPFIAYLLCGLVVFNSFNKALKDGTKSIKSFSFVMKMGHFRLALLPMVKVLSAMVIHLLTLIVALTIILIVGVKPSWHWFQVIYYLFATFCLLAGVTWGTSALVLFYPDIDYLINIILRVVFFLTPIFWSIKSFPEWVVPYFKINPLFYLVEGYRSCFLYKVPFWEDVYGAALFWGITLISIIAGSLTFKKLRPYFADVVK